MIKWFACSHQVIKAKSKHKKAEAYIVGIGLNSITVAMLSSLKIPVASFTKEVTQRLLELISLVKEATGRHKR